MRALPQTVRLQGALWENKARAARAEAAPQLSAILSHPVAPAGFTTQTEFETEMQRYRGISCDELRFRATERDAVVSRLREITALNSACNALLFFARSSEMGGLRVPRTPPAEVVLSLLDWDGDDVFVYDAAEHLLVHVDRGEDWLDPEQFGIAPREMLLIVRTPKT